jgi:hypothetical protein
MLLCVPRTSSPLSLVSLHVFTSISRFHSHVIVVGQLKYCTLSSETVFGLNLVSKHCSEFADFVKKLVFYVMPFSAS